MVEFSKPHSDCEIKYLVRTGSQRVLVAQKGDVGQTTEMQPLPRINQHSHYPGISY